MYTISNVFYPRPVPVLIQATFFFPVIVLGTHCARSRGITTGAVGFVPERPRSVGFFRRERGTENRSSPSQQAPS